MFSTCPEPACSALVEPAELAALSLSNGRTIQFYSARVLFALAGWQLSRKITRQTKGSRL